MYIHPLSLHPLYANFPLFKAMLQVFSEKPLQDSYRFWSFYFYAPKFRYFQRCLDFRKKKYVGQNQVNNVDSLTIAVWVNQKRLDRHYVGDCCLWTVLPTFWSENLFEIVPVKSLQNYDTFVFVITFVLHCGYVSNLV